MDFDERLTQMTAKGLITAKMQTIMYHFYATYRASLVKAGADTSRYLPLFDNLLDLVIEQIKNPFTFQPHHKAVTQPFNYQRFGVEFARPLIDWHHSKLNQIENICRIEAQIEQGHNVILLSNHQSEIDPQLFHLILEKNHPKLGAETIFVAGDRVITDPLAVPFSMGRNLLCIYSKRHIENPPEKKREKLLHNQKTMHLMRDLLQEGGKCFFVAPSGGRDRPNSQGVVEVAPFDPNSIEMIRLMAAGAHTPTHFYPLALRTYDIVPPPNTIEKEIGEKRSVAYAPIFFSFCDEVSLDNFIHLDRKERRERIASHFWHIVNQEYQRM